MLFMALPNRTSEQTRWLSKNLWGLQTDKEVLENCSITCLRSVLENGTRPPPTMSTFRDSIVLSIIQEFSQGDSNASQFDATDFTTRHGSVARESAVPCARHNARGIVQTAPSSLDCVNDLWHHHDSAFNRNAWLSSKRQLNENHHCEDREGWRGGGVAGWQACRPAGSKQKKRLRCRLR